MIIKNLFNYKKYKNISSFGWKFVKIYLPSPKQKDIFILKNKCLILNLYIHSPTMFKKMGKLRQPTELLSTYSRKTLRIIWGGDMKRNVYVCEKFQNGCPDALLLVGWLMDKMWSYH